MGDRTRRRVGMPPAGTFADRYFEPEAAETNYVMADKAIISYAISLKRMADMMEKNCDM